MFDWLTILKFGLQIINRIAEIIRDKQLMAAGEAQAVARSLVELQTRLGIGKEIDDEISRLTDEEARRRLNEDARP